ncbi:hypothetical protein [Alkaliphilus transvaalensis]|uniref:hypothetical protein n=1 Tax=Alkaliphilus transvaalensis TaxID=114628 RepID=UPI00047B66CC|nr:hypothetical protein [Alkaliphilus transvaalensis]
MNRKIDDELDEKIRNSLLKESKASVELKDEIWNKIEKRIDEVHYEKDFKMEGSRKMRTEIKKNNSRKRLWGIGTVAAALLIVFLAGTAPGHATIDRIREFFAPEKTITEELEGMEEERDVTLQKSKLGYVIYFDEEMFKMDALDGKDKIAPIHQADYVPEVYMEIQQVTDQSIDELKEALENLVKAEYEINRTEDSVTSPVEGILIQGQKGYQWDDIVVRYYLIDNTEGGTFIIKQQFFVEAFEGFGARFNNMLREFHIIKLEE